MDHELISRLRAWMEANHIDVWLDSGQDPHASEYPLRHWRTRTPLSGFRGSAAVVVLTQTAGLLVTDSRYWLQAASELGPDWELVRAEGSLDVALQERWNQGGPPAVIGLNPWQWSWERWQQWSHWARGWGITLVSAPDQPIRSWHHRPDPPAGLIRDFEADFPLDSRFLKLDRLRAELRRRRVAATLVAALDQIAWLLNLRGNDIDHNPLFESYLYVDLQDTVLFCRKDGLEEGLSARLEHDGIQVLDLEALDVDALLAERVLIDPATVPAALAQRLEDRLVSSAPAPLALMKAIKSPSEVDGFRRSMLADGRAMVRFLQWWESQTGPLTEAEVADKLWQLRQAEGAWIPSFATIAAWGPNAAIVHYDPQDQGALIQGDGLLLLDSGAHYAWGTTDVTRVLFRGAVRPEWQTDYTRVLQALIAVATTPFPRGARGYQLDALARGRLWRDRLHYGHGTGHGVGHVLSVHEGPQRLGSDANPQELLPGMVVSLEPGLYRPGRWGIRLENLALVREEQTNEFGAWLGFELLTLAPLEPRLVAAPMLSEAEKTWLWESHGELERRLGPHLDAAGQEWLRAQAKLWAKVLEG